MQPEAGSKIGNESPGEGGQAGGGAGEVGSAGGVVGDKAPKGMARTRPVQPEGEFPRRKLRWYQVTAGELRAVGVVQLAMAALASVGTFALGAYLDLQKDVAFAQANGDAVPEFLASVVAFAFWSWLTAWGLALAALAWQLVQIEGIKAEHGDPPPWKRLRAWIKR
jgi:hypothetical protein